MVCWQYRRYAKRSNTLPISRWFSSFISRGNGEIADVTVTPAVKTFVNMNHSPEELKATILQVASDLNKLEAGNAVAVGVVTYKSEYRYSTSALKLDRLVL